MSKTIKINANTINANTIDALFEKLLEREVEIKGATLKDSLCSYNYELLVGPTKGDTLKHNGNHIIHEDLQKAFDQFSVFFAHLDDAYTGNDNSTKIEDLINQKKTESYIVNSFSISGSEENRSLVISGTKFVSNGVINFPSPKVKLNGTYLYLLPLKNVLYNAITEVEEYRNGKTAPEHDENQVEMNFPDSGDVFASAKVEVEAEKIEE